METKSLRFIMKYGTNLTINYSQIIGKKDLNIKLSEYLYSMYNGGTSIVKDFYDFNDSTQTLTINTYTNNIVNISFVFEFENYSDDCEVYMKFILSPPLLINIEYGLCFFSCDICYYYYQICDINDCKNKYSFINDFNNNTCYPNNLILQKYVYNHTTNFFEKCYESCEFCSVMGDYSSQLNHNCLSCPEGYLKYFEYIGNCYKINEEDLNFDKIINNVDDISFTRVESCKNTKNQLKVNLTGECFSHCPIINIYKKYNYKENINFYSYFEDQEIPQYKEYEEPFPKYTFGNLCLENCPNDTYPD